MLSHANWGRTWKHSPFSSEQVQLEERQLLTHSSVFTWCWSSLARSEKKKNTKKGQKWVCSLWWQHFFLLNWSPRRTVGLAGKMPSFKGKLTEAQLWRRQERDCFLRCEIPDYAWGRGGDVAKKMVLLKKRTYQGGVLFYLVENIKELSLEIKETKNETYSTSWPWLGCLILVHWATRPKLKAKQSMGLGTRGNLNFHPSSSPSGPKDLLCLPYLPPRVRGLSEKTYAKEPGEVGDP